MPLGEHVTATVNFQHEQGARASCVLYYTITAGGVDQVSGPLLADAILARIDGPWLAVLPSSCELVNVVIRLRGSTEDWEFMSTEDVLQGTIEGDMLPEENAVVLQRRTGRPGRDARGRLFLPFIPELWADNSMLNGPAVLAYRTLCTALMDKITAGAATLDPAQPSFKTSTLYPLREMRVLNEICSRRDRRAPKRGQVFVAPAGTGSNS